MPTVAAVLAFHRNEAFFAEALASVLAQTVPPDEVVVVDDASPGEGVAALGPFPPGVRVIRHATNTGIGGTRQTGVDHSTSDLVAFLDGDDLWVPEKLERQLAFLRDHPEVDVAHSGTVVFRRDGSEVPHTTKPERLTLARQLQWNEVLLQTAIVPRPWIERVGGFTATRRFVPDWDFAIRLLEAGAVIGCLNEPLTRVRRWDHGNISQSGLRQMRRRCATVLHHWPLVRRELGLRGGVYSLAGIVEDEGSKVRHGIGRGWRAVAALMRAVSRVLPT